jgi:hypothetical protein
MRGGECLTVRLFARSEGSCASRSFMEREEAVGGKVKVFDREERCVGGGRPRYGTLESGRCLPSCLWGLGDDRILGCFATSHPND